MTNGTLSSEHGEIFSNKKNVDGQLLTSGLTSGALNEIEVFEHINFRGASWRTPLDYSFVGSWWNDKISSIIVYSGNWNFFEHKDFGGARLYLRPGTYSDIRQFQGWNDVISSWREDPRVSTQ